MVEETKEDHGSVSTKVSFSDSLHVHVHRQTVSLNPSVIRGPPIQLDWKVNESVFLSLAQEEADAVLRYEQSPKSTFEKQNVYPRPVARLSAEQRTKILQHNALTLPEIEDYAQQAESFRIQRNETIHNIKTRKERQEEMKEEKREKRKQSSGGGLACCSAATPPPVLDPVEQFLEHWQAQKAAGSTTSSTFESSSLTTVAEPIFLNGKSACKNCSQRAQLLDKACVHMFRCGGSCTTASGTFECPIHKFIAEHAGGVSPSTRKEYKLPQESSQERSQETVETELPTTPVES